MKKYFVVAISGMFLMIFAVSFALINISTAVKESSTATNEDKETIKVSLNFSPEENESNLVSSSLEEQVEVLGEGDVEETTGVGTASTTKQTTSATAATPTPSTPTEPSPPPLTNGTCPVSTLNCVPCNINDGYWACRVEQGEEDGYLGWSCQNNNPGNIRYSSARIGYIKKKGGPAPCGERVDSRGGTYMIFSSYQDGRNALKAYMKAVADATHTAYGECSDGNCSLSYVFSKYAPGDPNYASNIASKLGVSTNTSLQWVIANKFEALIDAIQQKEGFFAN